MIFDVIQSPMFLTYATIACIVILLGLVLHLHRKIRRLLIGKNSESLEDSIIVAKANLEKLNAFQRQVISHLETVEKRLNRSVQAVETVRFNPFKGIGEGGNQSFSTAIVSENGDGVVISSLYSRDRVSIFSKPLTNFTSSFELTEEEQSVVTNSQKSLG
jgi:hypothetical protein